MRHVIIGSGPAGVTAAETLRKADPACDITLLQGEPGVPYARMAIPYLLAGKIDEAGTHMRQSPGHYDRKRIRLLQGRARTVDHVSGKVVLEDGRTLPYDKLLVASGATPSLQKIPGIELPGVHTCWTLGDVHTFSGIMKPGTRVVQMGAGFVGCVIMAGLVSMGVELTILVRSGRMVSRMMNPAASGLIRRWCQSKGVRIRVNTLPNALRSAEGELRVVLDGGEELPADIYLCLVGVKPNIGFLAESGVAVKNGILVDSSMQTSVPGIYAAGDVAESTDCVTGERMVNAIQPNAVEQGRIAALNMAGKRATSRGTFAFNVLDTLGLLSHSFGAWQGLEGGESAELLDEERFRYLKLEFLDDRLVGANAVGFAGHAGVLRGLIEGRVRLGSWKHRLLQDPTQVLQAYLARTQKLA
jgi:NAD(P)H-nitrite reductase large subunit